MSLTIDQFVTNNNNKLINNGGIQCVAVANQYNRDVVESGWIGTPVTGYAIDWYDQFGKDPDYAKYVQIPATQAPQKGDIAVWRKYPSSGLPHIAIVLENRADGLYCFTQNPGNAHKELLTRSGIAGYLRPKKFIVAQPAPAPAQPAPVPAPAPAGFAVGDRVKPTSLIDYKGTHLAQWDPYYTITEVIGDRAVLSARGSVWAAMKTSNIVKV